jgi:hypothetical protein
MFLRVILLSAVLIGMFILIFSLLKEKTLITKKEKTPLKKKENNVFGGTLFKRVTGSFIILFTLIVSFRYVKILPITLKVGLIFINFVIIYLVINYFFNKQKTK